MNKYLIAIIALIVISVGGGLIYTRQQRLENVGTDTVSNTTSSTTQSLPPAGPQLVVTDNIKYTLTPPAGWLMDNGAGVADGIPAVFFKEGESWKADTSVMYTNSVSLAENKVTFDKLIEKDLQATKERSPKMKVENKEPIFTKGGTPTRVMYLTDVENKLYEAVAYIQATEDVSIIIVLHAVDKTDFDAEIKNFESLVQSYQLLTNDLQPANR